MQIDLTGKRAVVSGSTQGIGFAIAKGLAESGAHVVINGRTEAAVGARLRRSSCRAAPDAKVEGVAGRSRPPPQASRRSCAQLPAVDIVVNDVGIFEPKPFKKYSGCGLAADDRGQLSMIACA